MSIPKTIKIVPTTPNPSSGRRGNFLPSTPGVYLFKDKKGKVVYAGKATNLKVRVASYFSSQSTVHGSQYRRAIDEMLHEVARIDWVTTDSVIEALILEANLIRKYMPKYNVREKDDKSFLYVVITKEAFPKVQLMRGNEVGKFLIPNSQFLNKFQISNPKSTKIFGPYTSASSIRAALDLMRKWFPWSTCRPWPAAKSTEQRAKSKISSALRSKPYALSRLRPCFDYHIGRCPGVCIGAISRRDYMKNIRNVILMLEGKKAQVIKNVKCKMQNEAEGENFEEAEKLRWKLFALRHIRDVAVLTAEGIEQRAKSSEKFSKPYTLYPNPSINIFGRIEGYDISNISGTSAVGSMVVFQNGEPTKSEYRKFKIKTVAGINDVAMMREVLERRFKHAKITKLRNHKITNSKFNKFGISQFHNQIWPLPNLIVIDGGWGQVNAAREVVDDKRRQGLRSGRRPCLPSIPIIGIAKGFKRKQDRPIFKKDDPELARIVENYKDLLLRVRDEAHRFAVAYHRRWMRGRLDSSP